MMRFTIDKIDKPLLNPKKIARASRLAVNQVTSEIHKDVTREVPKAHGTSITGYRRVRSKKTLAKARKKRLRGIVWQGTMDIQAVYAGKPRKVKGGVKAGKHFFPGAFIATMKSGHVGIFSRIHGSKKIEEERIELDQARSIIESKAREALPKLPKLFREQYKKLIKR